MSRQPLQTTSQLQLPDTDSLESSNPVRQLTLAASQQNTKVYNDLVMIFNAMAQNVGILYFGDSAVDGTWRIVATTKLSVQLKVAGVWTEKFAVVP